MTDEPIRHVCCVCGARLPQFTSYELVKKGAGRDLGNGHLIFFCIGKHTEEQINDSQMGFPRFCRASELVK
jgi:hypothetical protein